jgi:uncharacterized protein
MTVKERLNDDLRAAIRAGDESGKSALRMALASIRNAEIQSRGDLDDAGVQQVLAREAKQRRESIAEFKKGGRSDLVSREQAELDRLLEYLPAQLTTEELEGIARRVITDLGASGQSDKGKVMPVLMKELAGRADGRLASQVVDQLLAG